MSDAASATTKPVSALHRRLVTGSPRSSSAGTIAPVPHGAAHPSLKLLIENIAEILNSAVALYCCLDARGRQAEVVCSCGLDARDVRLTRPRDGGLVSRALAAKRAVLEPLDSNRDAALIRAAGDRELTLALLAPVRPASGSAAALIAAFSARPPDPALTLWTAEACAPMLAVGAHRPESLDTILSASRLDTLTGCLNYAGIRRELEKEINRTSRGGVSLALGFIDLDGFKRINDEHGHLRGNDVLREVADVLRQSVRSCDTVGRFGGDEFIVILPDADEPAATRFATRVRARLTAASISAVGGPLTASVGVASWTPGATADELLGRADEALLRAKTHARGIAGPKASARVSGPPEASARASGPSAAVHPRRRILAP